MISRRVFLKNGAFAFVSLGWTPSFLARTVSAAGAGGRPKRLIAIFQRGAVDGLSVVVPFGEQSYYTSRPSIAIPRPGGGGRASEMFEAAYAAAPDRVLNGTGREAFDAIRLLKATDPGKYQPENNADYPRSPFGQALRQIAQLTKSNLGLEVAFADIGGWDTHVNQGAAQGQLAARLDDFSRSIAALIRDLGDRLEDTVVLTMSEFGRAVNENGNRGTDHGHGNAMMVIGGGVRGGRVYGKWPGLDVERRYDGRDLAVTTDFRDVFGEIVTRHLGVTDARQVFPGYPLSAARFPGLFGEELVSW